MSDRGPDAITTIPLRKATRDRLRELGGKGETYDAILNRLMDLALPPRGRGGRPPKPDLVDFERIDVEESPVEDPEEPQAEEPDADTDSAR
jgi:hypothetical protein